MLKIEDEEAETKAIAVRVTVAEMAAVFHTTAVEKTMKMIAPILAKKTATRAVAIIEVTIVIIIAIRAQSTNASLPDQETSALRSAANAAGRATNRLQSVAKLRLTKV